MLVSYIAKIVYTIRNITTQCTLCNARKKNMEKPFFFPSFHVSSRDIVFFLKFYHDKSLLRSYLKFTIYILSQYLQRCKTASSSLKKNIIPISQPNWMVWKRDKVALICLLVIFYSYSHYHSPTFRLIVW